MRIGYRAMELSFFADISPLIGAISAGNCAIIKPSEIATHTQNMIIEFINKNFPPEFIKTIEANPAGNGVNCYKKNLIIFSLPVAHELEKLLWERQLNS